jgi:hypothetical protein
MLRRSDLEQLLDWIRLGVRMAWRDWATFIDLEAEQEARARLSK